jgi:acetyl-CoA synthetase
VLMLGNQVELWEAMLAVIKLGAVVMPTTTAVGPGDLVDRMERGSARAVITNAREVHKFDDVPGDYVRIAVGGSSADGPAGDTSAAGWADYAA